MADAFHLACIRKRVGGLKLEELPGLDSLKTPGMFGIIIFYCIYLEVMILRMCIMLGFYYIYACKTVSIVNDQEVVMDKQR